MTPLRKACAGWMTWENLTGVRCFVIWSSLRAIDSLCATRSSNSAANSFSTVNGRRDSASVQNRTSICDGYGGSDVDRFEKCLGHEFRHSNTTVRRWVAGQIARMEPEFGSDLHVVRHWRAFEMRARRLRIIHRHVRFHNLAGRVDKISVLRGGVIFVFA